MTASIYVFSIIGGLIGLFVLLEWKRPLSQLNRTRLLDRKSLRVSENLGEEDVFKFRNRYIDKKRYIKLRESFFAMKMGYKPSNEKIAKLLKSLDSDLRKADADVRKGLAEIDFEILERMKQELNSGSLIVGDYIATSEDDGYEGAKFNLPVWFMLAFSVANGIFVFAESAPFIFSSFLGPSLVSAFLAVICAENVLRRSRNTILRQVAHFAQALAIGGLIVSIAWSIAAMLGIVSL